VVIIFQYLCQMDNSNTCNSFEYLGPRQVAKVQQSHTLCWIKHQIMQEAGDKLFTNVMYNKQHVLHSTLPGIMDTKYHLRPRPHNIKLIAKNSSITECDFITGMLFKDVY